MGYGTDGLPTLDSGPYLQSKSYPLLDGLTCVPTLRAGLLGCYRCGNVWTARKSPVTMCPRCKSRLWDAPRPARERSTKPRIGVGVKEVVTPHRAALQQLARGFHARNLRVFGSVARGQAGPRSDVDLLVTFDDPVGLLRREEFRERLEQLLGRKVDLVTEQGLHWLTRPTILAEAVPV